MTGGIVVIALLVIVIYRAMGGKPIRDSWDVPVIDKLFAGFGYLCGFMVVLACIGFAINLFGRWVPTAANQAAATVDSVVASLPTVSKDKITHATSGTEAVDSWNNFVEIVKSRIKDTEARWIGKYPKGKLTITWIKDDVTKSDSLKNPFRGVITCIGYKDYGENESRDSRVRDLEQQRKFYSQLAKGYFEQGIDNKDSQDVSKSVKELNDKISAALKEPSHQIAEHQYNLRFGHQGQSWVFTDGDIKTTQDNMARENEGRTRQFSHLDGWMLELFQ